MVSDNFPSGTLTFLFTDIEGSTRLWEHQPQAMSLALAHHDSLLRQVVSEHEGVVFKTVGDAFCTVFATAPQALRAAVEAQRRLAQADWGEIGLIRVRMALHTGVAQSRDNDYFGQTLNRVARLLAIGYGGQVLLSAATQELVRDYLPVGIELRSMGEHRLKDLVRSEHVFQLNFPDLPSEFSSLKSLETPLNNLPIQLTSFIGREETIVQVKKLLMADDVHLLTLIGPGGTGKTRLSLQVAAELVSEFANGVWFVELAALQDPSLVPQAVATVLQLRETPDEPLLTSLKSYLRTKKILLILDNCEHLVSACANLAASLIGACSNLRILASSRESLNIAGEQPFRVPSLSMPDLNAANQTNLTEYEAVRLFIERAVAVRPNFKVDNANAPIVAQICTRLDGIPLAIELAAARIKLLSVEQIAERLNDRFKLLTGGNRAALPRQQTLRALIDWSYDLLTEPERLLLQRLSVFIGGWTLEAAVGVCAEGMDEYEVLDYLTQLVNKSLVVADEQSRYRLLETIRQYAFEKLGDKEVMQGQHAKWYAGLLEAARVKIDGHTQRAWLERLSAEHDNIRVALEWAKNHDLKLGLLSVRCLGAFWNSQGFLSEGRSWLEFFLNAVKEIEPTRLPALDWATFLAFRQDDYVKAEFWGVQFLSYSREFQNQRSLCQALVHLGDISRARCQYTQAVNYYQEAIALADKLDPSVSSLRGLNNISMVLVEQGRFEEAVVASRKSVELARKHFGPAMLSWTLRNLARTLQVQARYEEAEEIIEESLALAREVGLNGSMPYTLETLALILLGLGEKSLALAAADEALTLAEKIQDKVGIAIALQAVGKIKLATEDYPQAWRAFEQSFKLGEDLDIPRIKLDCYEGMANVAARSGDVQKAVGLFEAAQKLADELESAWSMPDLEVHARSIGLIKDN